jgi:hypothetical protein
MATNWNRDRMRTRSRPPAPWVVWSMNSWFSPFASNCSDMADASEARPSVGHREVLHGLAEDEVDVLLLVEGGSRKISDSRSD